MSVLGQWSGSMSISLSVRRFSWMSGSGSGSIPVSYLVHCLCVCLHVFVTSLSLFFCICVSASVLYACSVLLTYFCLFLSPIGFLFAFQATGFCLSGWRWRPASDSWDACSPILCLNVCIFLSFSADFYVACWILVSLSAIQGILFPSITISVPLCGCSSTTEEDSSFA